MKEDLKLFVFEDFNPDWTPGLAFAIAENEGEAKKLISNKMGFEPWEWGRCIKKPLTKRTAFAVSGGG